MRMNSSADLTTFELPAAFVAPMLGALRLGNTALDSLFYDAGVLATELFWRGATVVTRTAAITEGLEESPPPIAGPAFAALDLGALANPEGCLLVVDPTRAPYVTRFDRVDDFIAAMEATGTPPNAVSITGVGSSALGSTAFAWNAATALGRPVVAIVPGYGLADVVNQALGGWFGFGLHDWLGAVAQEMLATVSPGTAMLGHRLLATTPGHAAGAPAFRSGSAASDVLHALLLALPNLRVVLGHSKGALSIGNALRSLPESTTRELWVMTFGCPIAEDVPTTRYVQVLGAFDSLGALNAWGHGFEVPVPAHHSTNTMIPFSMPIALLTRLGLSDPTAAKPTPHAMVPLACTPAALPAG